MSALRVLIVGHGRMGRLVESLAPEAGMDIAGRVDIDNADRPEDWPAADVAIDFSTAAAVPANARRLAARGTHLVIGTTGWKDQEESVRREMAAYPIGVVSAPNFALGVNLFVALAARAAELLADRPEFGAWIHELHHCTKRTRRPVRPSRSGKRCSRSATTCRSTLPRRAWVQCRAHIPSGSTARLRRSRLPTRPGTAAGLRGAPWSPPGGSTDAVDGFRCETFWGCSRNDFAR